MGGRGVGERGHAIHRGGARQSPHRAGQPELRGGPAGLLWGTGLGDGRALTLGDLASGAHQAGHGRCSPGAER